MSGKNNTTNVPLFEAEFRELIRVIRMKEPELVAILETTKVDTGDEHGTDDTRENGEAVS